VSGTGLNLIRAERLKQLLVSPDGLLPLTRSAIARATDSGWVLVYGAHVLRSARLDQPRAFKTLDAIARMASECHLASLVVELAGLSEPPSAPAKRSRRKARRG
jgi:hypothetical protein